MGVALFPSGYVLAMVTLVYLLNQVDRYLFSARIAEPPFVTKSQTGLITGPLFTLTYTVMGVLISFFGSQWKRARVLAIALIFWSGMTFATGFTTKFYQVAITRIGQSLGEAACACVALCGRLVLFSPGLVRFGFDCGVLGMQARRLRLASSATTFRPPPRVQPCRWVFLSFTERVPCTVALGVCSLSAFLFLLLPPPPPPPPPPVLQHWHLHRVQFGTVHRRSNYGPHQLGSQLHHLRQHRLCCCCAVLA